MDSISEGSMSKKETLGFTPQTDGSNFTQICTTHYARGNNLTIHGAEHE